VWGEVGRNQEAQRMWRFEGVVRRAAWRVLGLRRVLENNGEDILGADEVKARVVMRGCGRLEVSRREQDVGGWKNRRSMLLVLWRVKLSLMEHVFNASIARLGRSGPWSWRLRKCLHEHALHGLFDSPRLYRCNADTYMQTQ
jgi:hypothetical protein